MERSNLALCNMTKKYGEKADWDRSVLKSLKALSKRLGTVENKFCDAILVCSTEHTVPLMIGQIARKLREICDKGSRTVSKDSS